MDNKITIIGFKESGKTTYLLGMYDCMVRGIKSFNLIAVDNELDHFLDERYALLCEGIKPDSTNTIDLYVFHLAHNFTPVCDFEWLDYPGGILKERTSEKYKKLENDIKESDCLLFIVDGLLLSGITANDADDYQTKLEEKLRTDDGIRDEIRSFTRMSQEGLKLPPTGIVVTKCDLVNAKYQDAVRAAIRNSFSALFEGDGRVILPMTVSLGGPIEKGFRPNPCFIEQPIAFAVLHILLKYIVAANLTKLQNERYIEDNSGIIARTFHPHNLAKARENIKNLGEAIDKWSKDAFSLIDLFSDEKIIYIDGKEQNLKDYYRKSFADLSCTKELGDS